MIKLPEIPPIEKLVQLIGKSDKSFLLDSADGSHPMNRYSYAGITPRQVFSGNDNPWSDLGEAYREMNRTVESNDLFCGGLVGYFSYEQGTIPLYWFSLYDSVLVLDHKANEAFISSWKLSDNELKKEQDKWMDSLEKISVSDDDTKETSEIKKPWSFEEYEKKIKKIKGYLRAGDVYQINLTGRFEANTQKSASSIYRRLRKISPAPYAAFINGGDFQILSSSPESLIEIEGDQITTRPIKGTRRRDPDDQKDQKLQAKLLESPKDNAELLMIVDLERNDLGKVCEYGSIRVGTMGPRGTRIPKIESFAQVHHLVAEISGTLKSNITPVDALKALFPGGSITGAPKIRAMEIIKELEDHPRSVYTGALGYIGAGGKSQFNMPIRTLTKLGSNVYFHAGGGIVIDSDPLAEYEEVMVKAEGMIQSLVGATGRSPVQD